jgi:polyhydroxyalkanoate synthesis regulator phasin
MTRAGRILLPAWICGGLALGAGEARAGAYEDIVKEINEVASRQFNLQNEAQARERRLAEALRQGTHDTPEMKKLRERIEAHKREIAVLEAELRRQFETLPAVREDVERAKADRQTLRELDERRRALLEERDRRFTRSGETAPTPASP